MDTQSKEEIERLNQIIVSTTLKKSEFADLIGFSRQRFEQYADGNHDIQKITRKLFELGFSINWLYGEIGEMHLEKASEIDFEIINEYNYKLQNQNVLEWIDKVFKRPENFNKKSKIEYNDFIKRFDKGLPMNYKQYSELKRLGCNMKWTFTATGPMFSTTKAGNKLRNNYTLRTKEL
ncbi:MAG: hypothetical protein WC121_14395 [Candidatus Kapaibacterium sp.]